ncbi:hypothetical protein BLA29_013174, partial [Euroglyphus maynei]
MAPLTLNKNPVDEIPKEFLWHILKVINASRIDNFQVNPSNNHNLNDHIQSRQPIRDENNDEDGDDDDDDNDDENIRTDLNDEIDKELLHQMNKDDNQIDGKILVAHRLKRVCYLLLNAGKDGQIEMNQLELHICSHLIVGYARI